MNQNNLSTAQPDSKRGFTLVEIMIVVVIIGILASMAGLAFQKVRERSIATRVGNDLRVFADAFQQYALENGTYPPDSLHGVFPPEMLGYIKQSKFTGPTPAGGLYDWDAGSVNGIVAAVSIMNPSAGEDILLRIDEIIDDGSLSTGAVVGSGNRLLYVIEGS